MINIPLDQIRDKISTKTGLSHDDINQKIKAKLKALSGLISEEGAAHIVANELGVKLFEQGAALQVKNIMAGMRNVDFTAKVVQKYDVREYTNDKGSGKVGSMLVGDDSGVIRLVLWHKQADLMAQINEGDIVKLQAVYVRENNARKEVHVSEMSRIVINPAGVTINVKPMIPKEFSRKKISEIKEDDASIEVLATIVQVFDINFFEVCPQCNKRARAKDGAFECMSHGKVTPDYNYVLNLYVDDGSDNIRVVLWREQVDELLAMSKQQVLGFKQDPTSFEPLKTELLGNMIVISGRASRNATFDRIELVASKIKKDPDPAEELKSVRGVEPAKIQVAAKPAPKKLESKRSSDDVDELDIDKEMMDLEDL